jgi:hypothetical protein
MAQFAAPVSKTVDGKKTWLLTPEIVQQFDLDYKDFL